METLPQFPARVRFTDEGGYLTREAAAWQQRMWLRNGGLIAPTNNELVMSDDEDSGLEEYRHETAKLLDGLQSAGQGFDGEIRKDLDALKLAPQVYEAQRVEDMETRISSAMALIAELRKEIEDMKQGQLL